MQAEERKKEEYPHENPVQLKLGQTISVPRLKGKGKVVGIQGDTVQVQMGILRISANVRDLRR